MLFLGMAGAALLAAQPAREEPPGYVDRFPWVTPARGRKFYVSPAGNDDSTGTSPKKAWRSLEKASACDCRPGDQILLEGGTTIAGTLRLRGVKGTAAQPVTVTSYGKGRATINGGKGSASEVDSSEGVTIRDLKLVGAGPKTGNQRGIGLLIQGSRLVRAEQLDTSGFQHSGLEIRGSEDVKVTHVEAHENGFAGISSNGPQSKNVYVGYSRAINNPGDPTVLKNHSGNGIVLYDVDGATIEYCEAAYNGWDMPWTGNGPVGIWIATHANRVLIQFCVAHHNRSSSPSDGGGFDLDGGATNSILQYNYSHDNFGSGYLICQYLGAPPFKGNTVRYNISQDDGLRSHNSGIYLWVGGSGMESTLVHNNTIFNNKGSAVSMAGDPHYLDERLMAVFYNNIFYSTKPQILTGKVNARFAGNLYWSTGLPGFLADTTDSLKAWVDGPGMFADPMLRRGGPALLTDPMKLPALAEFLLLSGSPAIAGGLDLREQFGIDPGRRDFFGNPLPVAGPLSMGAHEAGGAKAK
jgi:hypothetical protein